MEKEKYVIMDFSAKKTKYGRLPFYDNQSNSFFSDLPFATFFKTLTRAELICKKAQKSHPDKLLHIREVNNVHDIMCSFGWK